MGQFIINDCGQVGLPEPLFINKETVRSHIRKIYQKLTVNGKAEALRVAGDRRWMGYSHGNNTLLAEGTPPIAVSF